MFRRHADDVFRFVARRVGQDGAADATAEVFRIALVRRDVFEPSRGHARAWLFGIATNVVRDHWRTEQRRNRAHARAAARQPVLIDPLLAVDDRITAIERLRAVHAALQQLTADDRDIVTMYAWERCSYAEIAVALDVPVGTVRSRLHRIRHTLSTHLFDEEEQ